MEKQKNDMYFFESDMEKINNKKFFNKKIDLFVKKCKITNKKYKEI